MPDQNVNRMKRATQEMDRLAQKLSDMGTDLPLRREDGSWNYATILRFLNDPEFQQYRDQYPEVVQDARRSVALRITTSGANTASSIAKLAFGVSQVVQASRADDRFPTGIRRPPRDESLSMEMTQASQDIEQGLSSAERSLAEQERDQTYRDTVKRAGEASGGNAALATAAALQAGRDRDREALRTRVMAERTRQQARQRMGQLLQLRQQEVQREFATDQFNFQNRDLPRWRAVNQAKQDLMRAGYTNAFRAADALGNDIDSLSQVFGPEMPGYVSRDNLVEDEGPLSAVFNNPLRTMQTGASLLSGASRMMDMAGMPGAAGMQDAAGALTGEIPLSDETRPQDNEINLSPSNYGFQALNQPWQAQ